MAKSTTTPSETQMPGSLSPATPGIIPWGPDGLAPGFVLSPDLRPWLHTVIGRELHPDLYRMHPQGHRLLVVPDPVSERTGSGMLYKPRSAQERQELMMGAGRVVAVGPLVGAAGAPHPVGLLCNHPADLLGRHIYYESYAGTTIRTNEEESEFGEKFSLVMLTDRDILAVDITIETGNNRP